MKLDSTGNMECTFGFKISLMRFLWRVKWSKFHRDFIKLDIHQPALSYLVDAKETGGVIAAWFANILNIVRVSNVTKVCNTVVGWIAVDVINLMLRPAAVGVKPSKTVAFERLSINLDHPVSAGMNGACNITYGNAVGCSDLSGKQSGFGIVGKQGFESVRRKLIGATSFCHVGNTEVCAVAVEKNKFGFRPSAVMVEPCKLTEQVRFGVDKDGLNIPVNYFANFPAVWTFVAHYEICKNSRFSIKVKKLTQFFWGKINSSHAVVPYKQWFGQRPNSISVLDGLRHFKPGAA